MIRPATDHLFLRGSPQSLSLLGRGRERRLRARVPPDQVQEGFGRLEISNGEVDEEANLPSRVALAASQLRSLGEGLAAPTPDVPRMVQYVSGAFGTIAGLLLIVLAVAALLERRRRTA